MNELVAPVTNITFSLEEALMAQMGALPVPFPGMDKVWIRKLWIQNINSVKFWLQILSSILIFRSFFLDQLKTKLFFYSFFRATWNADVTKSIEKRIVLNLTKKKTCIEVITEVLLLNLIYRTFVSVVGLNMRVSKHCLVPG